jgi:hypothetical protein
MGWAIYQAAFRHSLCFCGHRNDASALVRRLTVLPNPRMSTVRLLLEDQHATHMLFGHSPHRKTECELMAFGG